MDPSWGNGFCIRRRGSDDAFHYPNRSTVAARLPIICYHDPDDRWAQFGCLQRHLGKIRSVFLSLVFWCWFFVGFWRLGDCINSARKSRDVSLNAHGSPKKWAVMPWKHTQQPPHSINKICWRKKPSGFWSFNSLPRSWCVFGKIPCFFFPAGFCSMVFNQKPMATKKNMAKVCSCCDFFIVKFTVVFFVGVLCLPSFCEKTGVVDPTFGEKTQCFQFWR